MRPLLLASFFALLAAPALASAAPIEVPPIHFTERTLPNGLQVISSLDRSTPNVTVQVWYHVGAKDDPAGRSGFAHLFEHLMFKATRDMPPEEMDRLTEDVGGMNNAFTEDDTTAFYEVIPANHLQRLLWAEAERMSSLVVDAADFHSERDVVEEELRQRVLAAPYGRLFYIDIDKDSFRLSPYRRSAIGSIADLNTATLADVRAFHQAYYRPSDATLVVVGNFDPARLDAWVGKYFGPIPDPDVPMPQVHGTEPPRTAPASFTEHAPNAALPAVVITWLAPDAASPDAAALNVLQAVLSAGKASRLYNDLVYRDQIAAQIFADAELRNQGGLFYAGAILASGKSVDAGVAALQGEVARLRAAPVSPAELAIAKNQLLAQAVHDRETVDGRAMALGDAVVEEGSAERANSDIAEIAAVTPADVLRVARKYLAPDREVVIRYTEGPAAPEGPPAVPGATAAPLSPFIGAPAVLRPASERTPPPPVGAPVKANLPVPAERTLPNGLEVIVARSSDLPLIAADLLVRSGSVDDPRGRAGAAALTADLVTEGTTTRTAPEIARQIEALGAELRTGSASESSSVSTSVLSANAAPALAIMADVVENPIFAPKELERARSQRLDALAVAYQRPGSIASMLADPVVFAGTPLGHSADGDPASLKSIDRSDVVALHHLYWRPDNAVLVITGDVTPQEGFGLARDAFGSWMRPDASLPTTPPIEARGAPRDLAVDLPGTGQAAVVLVGPAIPRSDPRYFKALVANDVLGGGYSARLNEEIRVKRGLSYGAGSQLAATRSAGLILAEAQTRNDAAAQVASLMRQEIAALATRTASAEELTARTSALVGAYGRTVATADGLAAELGALAIGDAPLSQLDSYPQQVEAVDARQVQEIARRLFDPAAMSLIVVGEAKAFLPALKTADPSLLVIPVASLDPDSPTLEKPAAPPSP